MCHLWSLCDNPFQKKTLYTLWPNLQLLPCGFWGGGSLIFKDKITESFKYSEQIGLFTSRWGVHLLLIPRSLRQSILSNFNYLFYFLCNSGVILKELGENLSFSVKSEALPRIPSHIRNKTYEYRSSLRRLIRKLRIFFTNENVRKKLKVLVPFLSNQKAGGQLGLLSRSFSSQNLWIKTMRKPFSQKKLICKFLFNYLRAESQNQNMHLLKNVQKLNKKTSFF